MNSHQEPKSATQIFFYKLSTISVVTGMPNIWCTDVKLPPFFTSKFYLKLVKYMPISFCILIMAELGALFTKQNLTEKQEFDRYMFCMMHPLIYVFWATVAYYNDKVKQIIFFLTVTSKISFNDNEVEKQMIKRAKMFSIASIFLCIISLAAYVVAGLIKVRAGKSFTTVITVWPDVDDQSALANAGRAFLFISWGLMVFRLISAYVIVITTTICLSHQFKNLQMYFYRLDDIFTTRNLTQAEKEERYERALKIGIQMHSETLICKKQAEQALGPVLSGQLPFSIISLTMLMMQLVGSERTLQNLLSAACMMCAVLSTSGIFMCNAGDITVEAALLPTAMYSSGWQNCKGASNVRVRKLLLFAMTLGQQPVVFKAFDCVDLSYQSFVFIVKTAYSVFSVIY